MKIGDGLFLRTFKRIAKEFPEIESWDNIVDNQCMQFVTRGSSTSVLVTLNLYGDIISDLSAGMMGGSVLRQAQTTAKAALSLRRFTAPRRSTPA